MSIRTSDSGHIVHKLSSDLFKMFSDNFISRVSIIFVCIG